MTKCRLWASGERDYGCSYALPPAAGRSQSASARARFVVVSRLAGCSASALEKAPSAAAAAAAEDERRSRAGYRPRRSSGAWAAGARVRAADCRLALLRNWAVPRPSSASAILGARPARAARKSSSAAFGVARPEARIARAGRAATASFRSVRGGALVKRECRRAFALGLDAVGDAQQLRLRRPPACPSPCRQDTVVQAG